MVVMDSLERLADLLSAGGYGTVRRNEPMAVYTSYGIGGPADLLLVVNRVADLVTCVGLARQAGVPCTVLGGGTNVLVADAGIRGLVLINACEAYSIGQDGLLTAESGARLWDLAHATIEAGWAGLEWAIGVPGTLGGAVVGNAGAYGGCMADIVRWARLLEPDGRAHVVDAAALDYGYRTSALKAQAERALRPIVLEAGMQLQRGDVATLRARADDYSARRLANTPRGNSAGSVFKRTLQYPAGFLIEQAGIKGLRVGGVEVSTKHANFLINVAGATAQDVRNLIKLVQDKVWQSLGQRLECEIEFIGAWDESPAASGAAAPAAPGKEG
jgi:UDP-N-acetylmuramate dehydrogenase